MEPSNPPLQEVNGVYHTEEPSLRQALQRTQAQCDRTMKEFNKMRSYLDSVTGQFLFSFSLFLFSWLVLSTLLYFNIGLSCKTRG